MSRLEDIGFYTLSDSRVRQTSHKSPMWRGEVLLTDRCNFRCPYCRGLKKHLRGDMDYLFAKRLISTWYKDFLVNVRLSGGEPTLYRHLIKLVKYCKYRGVEHIAISTNGSAHINYYNSLIDAGVNDFSISLDACCSSFGEQMCGDIKGMWERVIDNIREISKRTYVTLGMVFTDETVHTVKDVVKFGSNLGVADIRIISAAQYNKILEGLKEIPSAILDKHPILKYRVNHYLSGRNVRGIQEKDSHKCAIVLDDSAVAGKYHFPCIIYLREGGKAIGKIGRHMREKRLEWFNNHNSFEDPICRTNCLDVCIDYNNKYRDYHG